VGAEGSENRTAPTSIRSKTLRSLNRKNTPLPRSNSSYDSCWKHAKEIAYLLHHVYSYNAKLFQTHKHILALQIGQ
jgi:hypothetical protein